MTRRPETTHPQGWSCSNNMSAKSRNGEVEKQFILRLPKPQASSVRNAIKNGTLKERLSIEMQADYRHATVRFDRAVLAGKVVDLPCVIESHKTVDNKSFYKTADICQVLVCPGQDEANQKLKEDDSICHKRESKKFLWNHGITPPLKNVRKRRFRKTAKKKLTESPEIEKEVKRLLRTDLSANSVTFEVVHDEEKPEGLVVSDPEQGASSPLTRMRESNTKTTQDGSSDEEDRNELLAILQEASSDEEDEEEEGTQEEKDEEDFDVDIEAFESIDNQKASKSLADETSVAQNDSMESARQRLLAIRAAKAEQQMRVNEAANPFLKQRFEKILEDLTNQEKEEEKLLSK